MSKDMYRKDIEDYEEGDEFYLRDDNAIDFWEKKQRELITSVVDYNLQSLSDLIANKTIDMVPKYQRRYRWDDERKSKLIESFLMNVPVPPIFLNEDSYGSYSVIDGKQRLSAIHEFMTGKLRLQKLTIFSDVNDMYFFDLTKKLQSVIRTRPTLRAIIILRQSDDDVKFEVFHRLNTGGVRLNPQEIRNSTFPGPLNDKILFLSEHKEFHKLLGIKNKNKSAIYKEMKDAEFVLRYFAYRDSWYNFSGAMKRSLDAYMLINQYMEINRLNELSQDFLKTIRVVGSCFGENSFKRWLTNSNKWKNKVSAPLYDAQVFAFRGYSESQILEKKEQIEIAFKNLFNNDVFLRAIESSTSAPVNFTTRIQMVKDILIDLIGD